MGGIPKQVEEAADMAEEVFAGMTPDEDEETQEEAPAEEEDTPPEENQDDEEEPGGEEEEEDTFEQRYRTLQSKYDKEVPRLHQELKDLKQSIVDRLGSLDKKEEQPVETPTVNAKLEKFREEYGDELFDYVKEMISVEGQNLFSEKSKPITEKVSSIEDTQIRAAQKAFNDVLNAKVNGDWSSLWNGDDPRFADFLQQPGPFGLMTYGQMLLNANDNWNADAMAEIFNHYLGQAKKPTRKNPAAEKQQEALSAPSRKASSAAPSADDKRIWSMDAIKEFQEADRKGKYKPEESKALWDDLLAAANEGRIQ